MFNCLLQYPNAYTGPIIAENSALKVGPTNTRPGYGTYIIGQGNFDFAPVGPKLLMQIGNQIQTFSPASLSEVEPKWRHIAVTRKGDVFQMYLDGVKLSPELILEPSNNDLPSPNNTIRFGRRTIGKKDTDPLDPNKHYEAQFYGLLDDVAVFNKTLSKEQIDSVINQEHHRLYGNENDLIAGWTFDDKTPNGGELPSILKKYSVNFKSLIPNLKSSKSVPTSYNHGTVWDKLVLDAYGAFQQVEIRLPFKYGQAWEVLQGNSNPNSSHNGTAAFCWDFKLADNNVNTGCENSNPTSCGQILYSVADGEVVQIKDIGNEGDVTVKGNPVPQPPKDAHNVIRVQQAPEEIISYMHTETGSIGELQGQIVDPAFGFGVNRDEPIARVGTRAANNCHLHFGATTKWEGGGVTFPIAFSNYFMSTDKGKTWNFVKRGIPQQGQWIKHIAMIPIPHG